MILFQCSFVFLYIDGSVIYLVFQFECSVLVASYVLYVGYIFKEIFIFYFVVGIVYNTIDEIIFTDILNHFINRRTSSG